MYMCVLLVRFHTGQVHVHGAKELLHIMQNVEQQMYWKVNMEYGVDDLSYKK